MTASHPAVRAIPAILATTSAARACLFALAAGVALVSPAAAQSPEAQVGQPDGWSLAVGGGFLVSPTYLGDDDMATSALPYIRVTRGDRFFASVQEGLGYRLIDGDGWRAGPVVTIEFGRDEEEGGNPFRIAGDDTTDLLGLGDIDTSFGVGGFVERDMGPLTASLRVRQATGGHEGLVGEAGVQYRARLGQGRAPTFVSVGPRVNFADETYHEAYFGVDAVQSLASGLAPYEAGSGLVSYGVGASVIRPITRQVTFVGVVGVDALASEVADAPLVDQRGSDTQTSIGAFLTYRLN